MTLYPALIKPALDRLLAGVLLLALLPLILVVSAAVLIGLGRPVFFRQLRPGLNGRPFRLVKFRTMRPGADSDAARLTQLGAWLRSTSLDELPELWNVICGDMSLVGPRPLLMQYLTRYSPEQNRRHEVKPGITGLAQVNGRNAVTWERKFELDVEYVGRCSFALDARIVARTLVAIVRREGVSQPGHATAAEFMGTEHP